MIGGKRTDYLPLEELIVNGLTCRQDLLRPGESVPPFAAKSSNEQQHLHSFQSERDRRNNRGGKDGSVVNALVCIPSLTR